MESQTIVKIQNLQKKYGQKQVLHGIDLEIKSGQLIGYIGPNGWRLRLLACWRFLGLSACCCGLRHGDKTAPRNPPHPSVVVGAGRFV